MKENVFFSIVGIIGAFISSLFGGWSASLTTLVMLMAIDYITGFVVAGVFNNSPKTLNGALESRAGWKGLCKKGVTLLIVLVAVRLDMSLNTTFIKDGVVIAFLANELISIIENAGLMGIPIPKVLTKSIEILKDKSESGGNSENTIEK